MPDTRPLAEGLNALGALACPRALSSIAENERLSLLRTALEAIAAAFGDAHLAELRELARVETWSSPMEERVQIASGAVLHALGLLAAAPAGCPIHGPACGA